MSKTFQYILIAAIVVIIVLLVAFRNKLQAMVAGNLSGNQEPDNSGSGTTKPKTTATAELDYLKLLQRGSKGAEVERLQKIVGAAQDGIFGPKTEEALKAYTKAVYGKAYDMITLKDLELIAAGKDPTNASAPGLVPFQSASYSSDNGNFMGNVFGSFFNWIS